MIGDKSPIEVVIRLMYERQNILVNLDKDTSPSNKDANFNRDSYIARQRESGNWYITTEHLDEAERYVKAHPGTIKILGDWRSYLKTSKFPSTAR